MPQRRRSKTREEWIASLRYNIKDAKEALHAAASMHDWRGVIKYARQLQALEPKLVRAESGILGPRRRMRAERIGEEHRRRLHARIERKELERRGWQFGR